jgi:hypothetical protein
MKKPKDCMLGACLALILAPTALAGTVTWDGDAADGLWTSPTNWDSNALPLAGDTVAISNGDTVDAVGLPSSNQLPAGVTVNLTGNSNLHQSSSALRLNGATIDVAAGSGLTGAWWDLNNATLKFKNGATATMTTWEQKGTNSFHFELGSSGFTPLTPGTMRITSPTTIANATYTVDMANYTGGSATITLIDFNADNSAMNDTIFQADVGGLNILNNGNYIASLHFSDALDALQLVVVRPVVWDGGGGDGKWTTASNWEANVVPVAGEIVQISNGGTIDTVDLASGFLPNNLDITLSGNTTLTQTGSVIRLQGADINVGAGSTLAGNWWDLANATLTFHDGASATMATWEQKGTNVFNFILGPTGFTKLTPGAFRISGTTIASATYNVDMANYTGGTGVITLVDFTTDNYGMDNATFQGAGGLNILNAGPYTADLRWNDTTEAIELHITGGPSTTLPNIIGITRDGGGNVTLTLDGPAAGLTVQQSDDLTGFNDIASTPSGNTLTIDAAETDPNTDGADFYRVRNN